MYVNLRSLGKYRLDQREKQETLLASAAFIKDTSVLNKSGGALQGVELEYMFISCNEW